MDNGNTYTVGAVFSSSPESLAIIWRVGAMLSRFFFFAMVDAKSIFDQIDVDGNLNLTDQNKNEKFEKTVLKIKNKKKPPQKKKKN